MVVTTDIYEVMNENMKKHPRFTRKKSDNYSCFKRKLKEYKKKNLDTELKGYIATKIKEVAPIQSIGSDTISHNRVEDFMAVLLDYIPEESHESIMEPITHYTLSAIEQLQNTTITWNKTEQEYQLTFDYNEDGVLSLLTTSKDIDSFETFCFIYEKFNEYYATKDQGKVLEKK